MTATSGRRLSALCVKSDPLGSLARTLLESSRWFSPARRLKWEAAPLFSTRITYTERSSSTSSKPSAKTSSVKDIPSSRLLFRLVPSERPKGETACGLLPTVQTQGLKRCNAEGKTEFMPLDLLPTPNAAEGEKYTTRYNSDSQMGKGLTAMAVNGLLPTPQTRDYKGECHMTQSCLPNTFQASQLNPLFVTEMMGFPLDWLVSPFQSGGQNPSKP